MKLNFSIGDFSGFPLLSELESDELELELLD